MKLTFLGTGTSTGVPQIGCDCEVCRSADPCDRRLRAAAIVENGDCRVLIDCGPDIRTQLLAANSPKLDAVLITHNHYDHVGGIDDLRPYCYPNPFPVYCDHRVLEDLQRRLPYSFAEKLYPGVPRFDIHVIDAHSQFEIKGLQVQALRVMHWTLPILGYRFGPLAYITDNKTLPEDTIAMLQGVDTLVLDALRWEEHPSHMNVEEALACAERIGARRVYFTHISHHMGLSADVKLPEGVQLAHDMLTITI